MSELYDKILDELGELSYELELKGGHDIYATITHKEGVAKEIFRIFIQSQIDLLEEIYNLDQSAIQIVANLKEEMAGLKKQLL